MNKNVIIMILTAVLIFLAYMMYTGSKRNQQLQVELQRNQVLIDSLQQDRKIFEDRILSDEKNLKKLYDKLKIVSTDSLTLNDAKQLLGL